MKAYAQFIEKDGITYRLNTLLQWGDSWDHIGNIVLANPESSHSIEKISDASDGKLSNFFKQFDERAYHRSDWVECSIDPTMLRIEKLFNGFYVDSKTVIELNGVIQLFNSFTIKNQNLEEAIASLPLDNELLYPIGIEKYFNNKPTYFGFSNAVLANDRLNPIVKSLFEKSSNDIKALYKKEFDDNAFYHPTYVNRAYKQKHFNRYIKEVLLPFRDLVKEHY